MYGLTDEIFQRAISAVNDQGYAAIDIASQLPDELGEKLFVAMNSANFGHGRTQYYNEVAFFWPEDWQDIDQGLSAFHEQITINCIFPSSQAVELLQNNFGQNFAQSISKFSLRVKTLTIANHHGLSNNELRLARVMVRQMNEHDCTEHVGSDFHEDIGYSGRAYQQLLSVIITTFGIPTEAHRYSPKVGELLIFNAFDRRRLLRMNEELAFVHKGPKTGPKLLFFFEFLGPRDSAEGASERSTRTACGAGQHNRT